MKEADQEVPQALVDLSFQSSGGSKGGNRWGGNRFSGGRGGRGGNSGGRGGRRW